MHFNKLLLISVFFIPGMTYAQNYTRDAGIRIGDYFSVTCRQFSEDDQALEGMLFIGRQGMNAIILKEYFQPALGHISEYLYFEYGYGAHVGFRYTDHYQILNRKYALDEKRTTPLLGINAIIGLEYRFPEFPFAISIDTKPYFEYSTIQLFGLYLNSVGLSLKYRF